MTTVTPTETTLGTVNGAEFSEAVRQVAVAADTSRNLYDAPWNGLLVEVQPGMLTLAATDRYRLGTRDVAMRSDARTPTTQLLLSARTLVEAAKTFRRSAEVMLSLTSEVDGRPALVLDDGAQDEVIVEQLPEPYAFPAQWRALFPPTVESMIVVDTKALQAAVREIAKVAKATKATMRLITHPTCHVTVCVRGLPRPESHIPLHNDDGPATDVDLDPQKLLAGVNALRGQWTVISFYKPKSDHGGRPIRFTCGAYTYLLMSRHATAPGA